MSANKSTYILMAICSLILLQNLHCSQNLRRTEPKKGVGKRKDVTTARKNLKDHLIRKGLVSKNASVKDVMSVSFRELYPRELLEEGIDTELICKKLASRLKILDTNKQDVYIKTLEALKSHDEGRAVNIQETSSTSTQQHPSIIQQNTKGLFTFQQNQYGIQKESVKNKKLKGADQAREALKDYLVRKGLLKKTADLKDVMLTTHTMLYPNCPAEESLDGEKIRKKLAERLDLPSRPVEGIYTKALKAFRFQNKESLEYILNENSTEIDRIPSNYEWKNVAKKRKLSDNLQHISIKKPRLE